MISFADLSAEPLFSRLSVSCKRRELLCLTGPNGSGKTTLLHLLQQEALRRRLSVLNLVQAGPKANDRSAGEQRGDLVSAHTRSQPELLLLDEPTNHLDQASFDRLIAQLRRYPGFLLVVTHDRRLLRLANRILHLEAGRLDEYGGGWRLYREQRQREAGARQRDAERLTRKADQAQRRLDRSVARQLHRSIHAETINRTQRNPKSLVHFQRNRADHTKARIETHHKRLLQEAEEAAALAGERRLSQGRPFDLRPPETVSSRRTMITVQRLQLRRGTLLTSPVSFNIRADSRIAVVGPCGSGKSTLLEAIVYRLHIASGEVMGRTKSAFLLDQRLTLLQPHEASVAEFFASRRSSADRGAARTLLAASGFAGSIQLQRLSSLSGGECMRLALTVAFAEECDLLLLDEPTNDLDQRARDEREEALAVYRGSLLVVSHDEEFLDSIGVRERVDLGDRNGSTGDRA